MAVGPWVRGSVGLAEQEAEPAPPTKPVYDLPLLAALELRSVRGVVALPALLLPLDLEAGQYDLLLEDATPGPHVLRLAPLLVGLLVGPDRVPLEARSRPDTPAAAGQPAGS